jgi:hypothetical protein
MKSPLEQYLDRLDELVGKKAEYYRITEEQELPSIWVVVYKDTPDEGNLTAFTFGLSSSNHAAWKLGRPELVISVNSSNIDWGLAIGFLVKRFQGKCPFSYGNAIRFGESICDESTMSAFFVFAPTILEKDQTHIHLPDRVINIVETYPIYEEEMRIIEQIGAQRFFMQESVDFSNIRRPNTAI